MEIQHKKALLGSHWLLRELPVGDLDALAHRSMVRGYAKDEMVFAKEDTSDDMMVVVSGRIRISSTSEKGKELILTSMFPGDLFGEIGLLDGGLRTADAVAEEASQVLVIRRGTFLPILSRNPDFCIKLLEILCSRLRRTSEQAEGLALLGLKDRLAKALLHFAGMGGEGEEPGVPVVIRMPQSDLAAMIGTTREAVNKQLRQWEDEGVIALKRGSLTVLSLTALEEATQA